MSYWRFLTRALYYDTFCLSCINSYCTPVGIVLIASKGATRVQWG